MEESIEACVRNGAPGVTYICVCLCVLDNLRLLLMDLYDCHLYPSVARRLRVRSFWYVGEIATDTSNQDNSKENKIPTYGSTMGSRY